MVFIICFMALFVIGPVQYFLPQLGHLQWVITILLAMLLLQVLFLAKRDKQKKGSPPGYMVFMGVFLAVALLSSLANTYLTEALLDAKNYFQCWSIAVAFFFIVSQDIPVMRLMKSLLILAFINTPLCVFQYYLRDSFPGDLVTGTFGGEISGQGGPNAALSVFQITQVAVIISLGLRRQIAWPKAIVLILWYLIPVGLTNAKATLLFLLIMTLLTLSRELLRRPFLSILGTTLMVCVFSALFYVHYHEADKYGMGESNSVKEFIEHSIAYNIESNKEGELTRLSAVTLWLNDNSPGKNPLHFFFGHGIGASKLAGLFQGHLTLITKYRDLNLGISTLTRLLWDVGIIGTTMFTLIFVSAFWSATKLKGNPVFTPMEASFLVSSQVACLFFILDIPYQSTHLNSQVYAAFVMLILGYIGFCKKKANTSRGAIVVDSVCTNCVPGQYSQKRLSL